MNTPRSEFGLEKLNFPLASDITHQVSKDYGVYIEDEGIATRGLFIIDPDGIIKYQVVHDLNVGRSASEVLRVLRALQTGGLCPLEWEPGDELLEG
ncbi:MAG: peroxiredoxin 2/4 [Candidatus Petromonas sp.]|jgi:alkyl hydroperoxide reductase subunit AhpC|nr:peroxiredoxin 2/4 [Candidatus Petromonas sp.]